jgi:hypothetical protein
MMSSNANKRSSLSWRADQTRRSLHFQRGNEEKLDAIRAQAEETASNRFNLDRQFWERQFAEERGKRELAEQNELALRLRER